MQVALESLGVFGFYLGLGVGSIGEHFAVELVLVRSGLVGSGLLGGGLLEGQGLLSGVEVVEFCLCLVAEKSGELGQGNGLF